MMSRQRAVRCQDDIAAIQGIRRFIPFGNTQADISPGGFGRSGYVLQILTDDDGLVIIALQSARSASERLPTVKPKVRP